ncbi:MAG: hypothetical protein AAF212_09760 [Verrucomicrobiota bacterium]
MKEFMKPQILFSLASILFAGCATNSTSPKEYKFVEVNSGIGTRVWTDENGMKKQIRVNERMRAEETANRMSLEGWTLMQFEEVPDLQKSSSGGFDARGTKIVLVFSRPKGD